MRSAEVSVVPEAYLEGDEGPWTPCGSDSMFEPMAMSKGWGERTAADLSSLLVELSRLYKGLTFYAPDHPARRELIDRAFLAWRVNLERAGPLELYLDRSEIRCGNLDESIGSDHLEELLGSLSSRGIRQLRFDTELSRESFRCLTELLTDERNAGEDSSFARTLYAAGSKGIVVNGEAPPKPDPLPEPFPPEPAHHRRQPPEPSIADLSLGAPNPGVSGASGAGRSAPSTSEPGAGRPTAAEPPATRPPTPPPAAAAPPPGAQPPAANAPAAPSPAEAAPATREPAAAPLAPTSPARPAPNGPPLAEPAPARASLANPDPAGPPLAEAAPCGPAPSVPSLAAASLADASLAGTSTAGTSSAGASPAESPGAQPSRPEQPGSPVASLGSALLGVADLQQSGSAGQERNTDSPRPPATGGDTVGQVPPGVPPAAPAQPANSVCSIEDDPFEAPAADMKGERLRLSLRELDRCSEDAIYESITLRIVGWMAELGDANRLDESFRVMLVLADHAAGLGGRSGSQLRMAQGTLEELAAKFLIVDLIDRSCTRERSKGVRPAQVLLQLGERAVPSLLQRLEDESDPRRSAEISALVIAMGEHAVPALARSLSHPTSHGRVQLAVRLAGELQNPKLIPILANVLTEGGPALRKEAAKALVHIGNSEATNVLIKALSSPLEDLPRTAALCLGVLGDARAVEPLLAALERAASGRKPQLAEGIIRALGPFSASAELVVPKLAAVLDQRSLVRRRHLRGPKLAALIALESFGGSDAQQAIVAATNDRDSAVCERAREILARRH